MGSTKKHSSERSKRDQKSKRNKSSNSNSSTIKQSPTNTSPSTHNGNLTLQVSSTNSSTLAGSEPCTTNILGFDQTSDDRYVSTWSGHTALDFFGLASQTYEGYQLDASGQASIVDPAPTVITQPIGCPYHDPILLMGNSSGGNQQNLDPMARWLSEGHAEQCNILHLHDGRLSIHKACQCSNIVKLEM